VFLLSNGKFRDKKKVADSRHLVTVLNLVGCEDHEFKITDFARLFDSFFELVLMLDGF